MDEWLDNFQMMGISLTEGEKILMRMAIDKERRRIIQKLISLREQYNIESMDLNEIRVAKYEVICTAIELISSAENLGGK